MTEVFAYIGGITVLGLFTWILAHITSYVMDGLRGGHRYNNSPNMTKAVIYEMVSNYFLKVTDRIAALEEAQQLAAKGKKKNGK